MPDQTQAHTASGDGTGGPAQCQDGSHDDSSYVPQTGAAVGCQEEALYDSIHSPPTAAQPHEGFQIDHPGGSAFHVPTAPSVVTVLRRVLPRKPQHGPDPTKPKANLPTCTDQGALMAPRQSGGMQEEMEHEYDCIPEQQLLRSLSLKSGKEEQAQGYESVRKKRSFTTSQVHFRIQRPQPLGQPTFSESDKYHVYHTLTGPTSDDPGVEDERFHYYSRVNTPPSVKLLEANPVPTYEQVLTGQLENCEEPCAKHRYDVPQYSNSVHTTVKPRPLGSEVVPCFLESTSITPTNPQFLTTVEGPICVRVGNEHDSTAGTVRKTAVLPLEPGRGNSTDERGNNKLCTPKLRKALDPARGATIYEEPLDDTLSHRSQSSHRNSPQPPEQVFDDPTYAMGLAHLQKH